MEIRAVGAELLHVGREIYTDGQTDMTRLTVAFRNFVNSQNLNNLPTDCIKVFYKYLRTNSYYFPVQNLLTGFHNRDGKCLLRGTN
jgi:hypothetical protein